MACQTRGSFEARVLADGSRAFHLRFQINRKRECLVLHERPNCGCGCGGGWGEMAARTELGDVLARVRAGVWERPKAPRGLARFGGPRDAPTFAEYAAWWLQAKRTGTLGDRAISESTLRHYGVCVSHLEAHLGSYPLSRIDADACFELKAHLVEEARVLRERIAVGQVSRDACGNPLRPLGAATIRTVLNILAAILEEAVEDRHLSANPARSRRLAVKVPNHAALSSRLRSWPICLGRRQTKTARLDPIAVQSRGARRRRQSPSSPPSGCGLRRSPSGWGSRPRL